MPQSGLSSCFQPFQRLGSSPIGWLSRHSVQVEDTMGSMSIWHWIVVIGVVLLLFSRGKISDLMGDVAQGIKAFKMGMADDDDKPVAKSEPVKTIDNTAPPQQPAPRQDVGSNADRTPRTKTTRDSKT